MTVQKVIKGPLGAARAHSTEPSGVQMIKLRLFLVERGGDPVQRIRTFGVKLQHIKQFEKSPKDF
jgi:hypothetical protein